MYDELVKRLRLAKAVLSRNKDLIALLSEAADAIEELQGRAKVLEKVADKWCEAVPKWIPVTERLPEKRGWYLANVFSLGVRWGEITTEDSEWIQLVFYHEGKFYKLTGSNGKVTHWMPLPEPPDDPKLSATIKCGGAVTCAVAYSEEVYGKHTDTAGNLRWTGTHSGEHIIPAEGGET